MSCSVGFFAFKQQQFFLHVCWVTKDRVQLPGSVGDKASGHVRIFTIGDQPGAFDAGFERFDLEPAVKLKSSNLTAFESQR